MSILDIIVVRDVVACQVYASVPTCLPVLFSHHSSQGIVVVILLVVEGWQSGLLRLS